MGMLLLAAALAGFSLARAEVSANLHRREIVGEKSHRVEEAWWENDEGERVVPDDLGWATVRYQYNKKPRCIQEAYYDAEDNLCLNRDGYAMIRQKWDGNGRRLLREYYDAEEKPTAGPEGYFREENKYDHMKLDHTSRFDTEGNPVKGDGVWAVTQYEYDSRRRCTKAEYLDAEGKAVNGPGGYAVMTREYFKKEMCSEAFTDRDGKPVYNAERGYASFRKIYDDNGRMIREEYFGADGKPLLYKGKYAVCENEYDPGVELPARVRYYDTEGKLIIQPGGWAMVAYTYGRKGRIESATYFNEHDERTMISEGYSMVKRLYTNAGDISREAYYDIEDRLVIHPEKGYAMVERKMQSPGYPRYEAYFDAEGNPMTLEGGYHALSFEWKMKRKIRETCLDLDDKPVNNTQGYATVLYEYDEDGKNTAREYLNAEDEPVEGGRGYTRCEISYYHEKPGSYRYYGADGQPAKGPEGAYELRYRYDEFSAVAEISFYDAEGKAEACSEGWHRFTQKRDENGRIIEKMYFGTDGYLTAGKEGWAGQTTEYDERGRISVQTTYGRDGNPGPVKDTYATVYYLYKGESSQTEAVFYFDGEGEPVRCKKGSYGIRYPRNSEGKVAGERYLDAEGNPMTVEKGYAGTDYTYSESGKIAQITYVGPDGKPVEIGIGYCTVEMDYDEKGKVTVQRYLNLKGETVHTENTEP